MGVRSAGVLRLGRQRFEPSQLLVMAVVPGPGSDPAVVGSDPAAAMERVHSAVAEGADIVEVSGDAVVPFVATMRDVYPELVIGVRIGREAVAREAVAREACAAGADLLAGGSFFAVAAEFGVGLVDSLAGAARAVDAGVEPDRLIVEGSQVAELVGTGWPILASLPDSDLAGDLARAAVFGWLGARVFRVGQVRETRRALSMVSAIRGDIPPAYAVRGLA